MSEIILRVGKKGEIYTTREIREKTGIKPGGRVRARIEEGRLVLENMPSLEELLSDTIAELDPEEAEKLSIEAQKEAGIYE